MIFSEAYAQARNQGGRRGESPLEICVGHSLKNLDHSQKTFSPLVSQVGYGPAYALQSADKTSVAEQSCYHADQW